MTLLVIDCATEACSVALLDDDTLIAGTYAELGRGHAEALVPMIAALPGQGGADRIMVNLGPGSFTGIRVGLAAARALGLAWGVPVTGYPCLNLVAAMARATHPNTPIDAVMTGGHGEWFLQSFGADGCALAPLVSLPPDAAIAASDSPIVAGTQAEALVARRGSGQALTLRPDARAFGLLAQDAWCNNINPIYGRAPDAKLPNRPQPAAASA